MKSLWRDDAAAQFKTPLELRAYTSRLLGQSEDLVLHGGGNTSVKDKARNVFGEDEHILYVKGSGHDLNTIGPEGHSATRLDVLKRLATLAGLSDTDMMRELKCSQIDPGAPTPSVEAILHAIIPFKYVEHTHADAVVAISNTQGGEEKIRQLFGEDTLILPYEMPGFLLSKQVHEATLDFDWSSCRAIILLHHGAFTFHDDARTSYENMIQIVTEAEDYIRRKNAMDIAEGNLPGIDALEFARLRKEVSRIRQRPVAARFSPDPFAAVADVESCGTRGPLTPDHVLHTKRIPMLMTGRHREDVENFAQAYQSYFERNTQAGLACLDKAPRWGIYKDKGIASFAVNGKRLKVCADIVEHTVRAIQRGEKMGGWAALSEKEIFDLEYWELEQAKLKVQKSAGEFEGRVAVVTGAASGIGKATARVFVEEGACVVGVDIDQSVLDAADSAQYHGIVADLTDSRQVQQALADGVLHFGGLDILVSNAGSFPAGAYLEETTDEQWDATLRLNLDSHFKVLRAAIPFLKEGFDASVIVIGSKNCLAPGPGAGAYSVSKAGLTQLARVAAMELAGDNIRVNVLHPDAVFDTGIWSDEMLEERAEKYGLSIEEYKHRNLLGTQINSRDIARAALSLASRNFAKSTGLQLAIDGGNERTL